MSDSIVIIPTYNEEENVENMIRKVMSFEKEYHILFVDDSCLLWIAIYCVIGGFVLFVGCS